MKATQTKSESSFSRKQSQLPLKDCTKGTFGRVLVTLSETCASTAAFERDLMYLPFCHHIQQHSPLCFTFHDPLERQTVHHCPIASLTREAGTRGYRRQFLMENYYYRSISNIIDGIGRKKKPTKSCFPK